jgi:hypothetical protein
VKVSIPMGARITAKECPKTHEEIGYMACVPYASVVGSLMYVMVCTRPYISHTVGMLSRYMSTPINKHSTVVKRLFRYLCGKKDYAI